MAIKQVSTLINSLKNPNDPNIKAAISFCSGDTINGEKLLEGINSVNKDIIISGGIAGDYSKNENSFVFTQDGIINNGAVIATLSNKNLHINSQYSFNWDSFGVAHTITKSEKNRIYTIDNYNAIDFFKYYLGNQIENHLFINRY